MGPGAFLLPTTSGGTWSGRSVEGFGRRRGGWRGDVRRARKIIRLRLARSGAGGTVTGCEAAAIAKTSWRRSAQTSFHDVLHAATLNAPVSAAARGLSGDGWPGPRLTR